MRTTKYTYLFVAFTLFMSKQMMAQDLHYSQFYTSPVLMNPATAGTSNSDFRLALNYRNQWKSVISPFKTMALAFDSKIYTNKKRKDNRMANYIGYGFTMFNDKGGASKLTTNQLNLDLSYTVYFNNRNSLSAGVSGGFFQRTINTSDLKWDAQFNGRTYDASLPTAETAVFQSFMKLDIGAGLMYKYQQRASGTRFELGASMAHITKPTVSFYDQDPSLNFKYIGHSLLHIKVDKNIYLIPTAMYALQGKHTELTGGANVKYVFEDQAKEGEMLKTTRKATSAVQFGVFHRLKDAVYFTAALEYNETMTFGISYDVNVSKLNKASRLRGGYELSFILVQKKGSKLRTKY